MQAYQPPTSKFTETADIFALLPEQFFGGNAESRCKNLLLAVLEDFVDCIVKDCANSGISTRSARLFAEDLAYLRSPDTAELCSFERCCEILGIDAAYIRKGILQKIEEVLLHPPARRRYKGPHHGEAA